MQAYCICSNYACGAYIPEKKRIILSLLGPNLPFVLVSIMAREPGIVAAKPAHVFGASNEEAMSDSYILVSIILRLSIVQYFLFLGT